MNHAVALPQHEECFNYIWLKESSRNQRYTSGGNGCDSSLSGWYRFGGAAGIKIATTCVPKGRCGTDASGWMNGAHPTVAEGKVTREVCYTYYSCCDWPNNIEVVNCGEYYVYKLIGNSANPCHLRYCGSDN